MEIQTSLGLAARHQWKIREQDHELQSQWCADR
jgi:hypothetical protein